MKFFKGLFPNFFSRLILVLYTLLLFFWVWINLNGFKEGLVNNIFGFSYPIISLLGGLYGIFIVSKGWGGIKSVVGRSITFLSLGLFGEVLGQWVWSYYVLFRGLEIPYPSLADIGYFSIIPFYGYAMFNLARASGVKVNLKNYRGRIQAFLIPFLMVGIAYFLFLRNIEVDFSSPLKTFLDFGYPGFEAIAVSIGILTLSLSHGILGGRMKKKVLFLIFALICQYLTDYAFLYTVGTGTYFNGGIVDLMYATSLTIMVLGIIQFVEPKELSNANS